MHLYITTQKWWWIDAGIILWWCMLVSPFIMRGWGPLTWRVCHCTCLSQEVTHPCDGRRPHAHAMAGGHTPFLDKPMQARGGKGLAGSPVFSFPPRSRAWCAQALYALARKICCAVNSILFHTDNKIWTWCIHLFNMIQGRMTYKIMNQIIR